MCGFCRMPAFRFRTCVPSQRPVSRHPIMCWGRPRRYLPFRRPEMSIASSILPSEKLADLAAAARSIAS